MNEAKPTVTRPDFEALIGRALAIQERADERVDLARARAIALELGVSPAAWDETLEERRLATHAPASPPASRVPFPKPLSVAVLSSMSVRALAVTGTLLGATAAVVASRLGGIDAPLGVAGFVLGSLIAAESSRRDPSRWRARIGTWWTSLTIGMMVGIGGLHPDPMVYGAAGWLLSEVVAWATRRRKTS
jgi:hypothetical protein